MNTKKNILILFSAVLILLLLNCSAVFAAEDTTGSITETGEVLIDDGMSDENIDMPESDELLMDFLSEHASAEAMMAGTDGSNTRGSRLTGNNATVYKYVKQAIIKIAAGEVDSAKVMIPVASLTGGQLKFTARDLGVSSVVQGSDISDEAVDALAQKCTFSGNAVLSALLADCPYELYWLDKIHGYHAVGLDLTLGYEDGETVLMFSDSDPAIELDLFVSKDYSKTGELETTEIDQSKTLSASSAAETAGAIVKDNEGKSDLEKLKAYKDIVCDLTSYNTEVTSSADGYGDPWQIIYVFDDDINTNVVCEGYAKAFQFLCDLTSFKSRYIRSSIISGKMTVGNITGGHMWNVVHMNDGKNYLVDVTNCDDTSLGAPDLLFLKGYSSGSMSSGYTYKCRYSSIKYVYGEDTLNLYDEDELILSDKAYVEVSDPDDPVCQHDYQVIAGTAKAATCVEDGKEADKECTKCHNVIKGKVISRLGHKKPLQKVSLKKATHNAAGNILYYKCPACGVCFKDAEAKKEISLSETVIPKNGFNVTLKKSQFAAKAKKKTKIKASAIYKIQGKKGKVTYKIAKKNKKIKVAGNGTITVKKGLKKNKTYTIKVKVRTAASNKYAACTRTVRIKIKIG